MFYLIQIQPMLMLNRKLLCNNGSSHCYSNTTYVNVKLNLLTVNKRLSDNSNTTYVNVKLKRQ